jgi:FxsC-like protein
MHPVAEPIQYHTNALGEPYRRLGVRQLMRLRRYQDDYRSLVFELARQVVEGVEQHPVPPGALQLRFEDVASAFHEPVPLLDELTVIDGRPRPLLVHLVVAASSRREMSTIRTDVAAYGDRPVEWSPFRPPLPEPLAEYARSIAADHCFETRIADLTELSGRAELAAHDDHQILVLLVDAWITRLDGARQALRAHTARTGQARFPTTAVLIPNSRDDMETRQHWAGLSRACREVLDRLARDNELYRPDITTYRHFELELPGVLEVAKNRLYRSGPARRSPGSGVSPQPPRIDGISADQEEEQP